MSTMDSVNFDSLFCLFKGDVGLRKSGAALSFPGPHYFFDYDGKMDALRIPMRKWGIDPKLIEFDTYNNWDKMKEKLERFTLNCKYRTLVVDSITSLGDAINRQTLKDKARDTTGTGGKKIGTIPVNSIEDFNAEDSALKEMIALLKDIREYHRTQNNHINIILIGHVIQKEMKSADGKTKMSRSIVTAGKGIAQKIPAYCSEVYHFDLEEGFEIGKPNNEGYGLWTVHTGDDFARTSLELPPYIKFGSEPLFDKFLKVPMTEAQKKYVPPVKF